MKNFLRGRRRIKPPQFRVVLWIVATLTMGFLWQSTRDEISTRSDQFCQLILENHHDRVKRVETTHDYLRSPQGKEETGLNEYIREVSLPQTEQEVSSEAKRLPASCK